GRGIARSTAAKWCRYARHFFEVAQRHEHISANPFAHIKGQVRGNPARRVFVPGQTVQQIIDATPDLEWKVLIALARFGGLRVPSEALALTWQDVQWDAKRLIVRASKTEHHADGGVRVVPLFPEIAGLLQQAFDEAEPGATFVISRYRDPTANLRQHFCRLIERAGHTPWPKPWQNLRATRATELADHYPSHVCAA
ncbi:MAG: tyrosine-type recombinase/integrase, partial [Phycisphaerae bacterium]